MKVALECVELRFSGGQSCRPVRDDTLEIEMNAVWPEAGAQRHGDEVVVQVGIAGKAEVERGPATPFAS